MCSCAGRRNKGSNGKGAAAQDKGVDLGLELGLGLGSETSKLALLLKNRLKIGLKRLYLEPRF